LGTLSLPFLIVILEPVIARRRKEEVVRRKKDALFEADSAKVERGRPFIRPFEQEFLLKMIIF